MKLIQCKKADNESNITAIDCFMYIFFENFESSIIFCFLLFPYVFSSFFTGQNEDLRLGDHKCYICSETMGSVISLKIHLKNRHEHKDVVPKFQCLTCGEVFIEENSYNLHIPIHESPENSTHLCNFCRTTYSSNQNLQEHINIQHTYKNLNEEAPQKNT